VDAAQGVGALGDHNPDERQAVIDLFGFERQLIFPTGSFPQAMAAPVDTSALRRSRERISAGRSRRRTPIYTRSRATYPHHEGSDNLIGRFERSMDDVDADARAHFFAGNFERLLSGAPVS
jgi:hypothetical protein